MGTASWVAMESELVVEARVLVMMGAGEMVKACRGMPAKESACSNSVTSAGTSTRICTGIRVMSAAIASADVPSSPESWASSSPTSGSDGGDESASKMDRESEAKLACLEMAELTRSFLIWISSAGVARVMLTSSFTVGTVLFSLSKSVEAGKGVLSATARVDR